MPRYLKRAVFLVVANAVPAWSASQSSCKLGANDQSFAFARDISRVIALNQFERDPAAFCDEQMAYRALTARDPSDGALATTREVEQAQRTGSLIPLLEAKVNGLPEDKLNSGNPWTNIFRPLESERLRATTRNWVYEWSGASNPFGGAIVSRQFDLDGAMGVLRNSPCAVPRWSKPPSDTNAGSDRLPWPIERAAEAYTCAELVPGRSCTAPFRVAQRLGGNGVELYKAVLDDARYDEGLRRAALTIGQRVKDKSHAGHDLFDDVRTSFVAAGARPGDAVEMTWTTLALLATGGPNVDFRMSDYFKRDSRQTQKRLAITTIATALPVLDHRSAHDGHIYSFPASVKAKCNSGKAYHFWYSAYFARRAAIETGDAAASAAVAFISEKAYQALIRDAGSFRAMARSPLHSPASEIVRADLSYAAAGATFGAASAYGQTRSLDVDAGIADLMRRSGEGRPGLLIRAAGVASQTASDYGTWVTKFNPDRAFHASARDLEFDRSGLNRMVLDFEARPTAAPPCR